MKKSGKLLTLTKLGMSSVLILCVSLATLFMASCKTIEEEVTVSGRFINKDGCLVLTYSDGTEEAIGHIRGVRGVNGYADPVGQDIVEVKTDDLNQLTVAYSGGLTDEFGRVDIPADAPDGFPDRVRIDSVRHNGNKMTVYYSRGESVTVDVDCDDKCMFGSPIDDADIIMDEVRCHKADECGIYKCRCNDCGKQSVFHGIHHTVSEQFIPKTPGRDLGFDNDGHVGACEGRIEKRCEVCGELVSSEEYGPKEHTWLTQCGEHKWFKSKDPTYESEGVLESYCTVCHKFLFHRVPKLPWFLDEYKAAGYAEVNEIRKKEFCADTEGIADYTYEYQGEKFVYRAHMPATLHRIAGKDLAGYVLRNENGEPEYSVKNCNWLRIRYEKVKELNALAAKAGKQGIAEQIKGTCAEPGLGWFTCEECGQKVEVEIVYPHQPPATENVLFDREGDHEPDCERGGVGHGPCRICGKDVTVIGHDMNDSGKRNNYDVYYLEELDYLGHDYEYGPELTVINWVESNTDGYIIGKCRRCGKEYKQHIKVEWHREAGWAWFTGVYDGVEYCTEKREMPHVIRDKYKNIIPLTDIAYTRVNEGKLEVALMTDAEELVWAREKDGVFASGDGQYTIDKGFRSKNCLLVVDVLKVNGLIRSGRVDEDFLLEFIDHKADCKDGSYGRGYIRCSECGECLLFATHRDHEGLYIPAVKRISGKDGWTKTEPTCTEEGLWEYECPYCHSYTETESIPPLGHDYWYDRAYKNPDGTFTIERHCRRCGEKSVLEDVPEEDMILIEYIKPTHTEKGKKCYYYIEDRYRNPIYCEELDTTGECSVNIRVIKKDGYKDIVSYKPMFLNEVAKTDDEGNHLRDGELWVLDIDDMKFIGPDGKCIITEFKGQNANCIDSADGTYGRGYVVCVECNKHVLVATFKGHKGHKVISEKLPTCEEDGYRELECNFCHEVYKEILPKLGHDYIIEYSYKPDLFNGGRVRISCSRCDLSLVIDLPALIAKDEKGNYWYAQEEIVPGESSNYVINLKDLCPELKDDIKAEFRDIYSYRSK